MAYDWSTHQVTEYFAAVSAPQDEHLAIMVAAERAAEALDAPVCAVVIGNEVRGCVGLDTAPQSAALDAAPQSAALAAVTGGDSVTLDGLGMLHAAASDLGQGASDRLVVARPAESFGQQERQMLQGMASVLGLALRGLRILAAERTLREEREREADERLQLLDALRIRQRLLETLLGIQRSISNRKPLQEVLDAVTSGAAGLLNNAVVTLVLADPSSGNLIEAWTCGPRDSPRDEKLVLAAASEAMKANCVVTHADPYNPAASPGIIAAPVHVSGAIGGSLAAYALGDLGQLGEQRELLAAFAQQVSLALTDARAVEAMREAYHDQLTGLPNRALFLERLRQAITATDGHVTVLFIDLDRFKAVNDSLGHKAGDDLLAAVGERIGASLRSGDTAARLGGDEFAVLLESAGPRAGVRVARTIIDAVKEPFRVAGRDVCIAASVGVASSRVSTSDAGDLLSNADVAMYRAKKAGPGRIVIFEPYMHTEILERLNLQGDLQRALGLGEFRLKYQPLVRLTTGDPVGVEALLRWTHPERGSVPPSVSIPIAEETGFIVELGRWVLRESCRQLAEWRGTIRSMTLNVNVSARQTVDPGFVSDVAGALATSNLPPEVLTLELTETALMSDPEKAQQQIRHLKDLGVRLSVDDFGTGYSSLSYLRQFPVDQLKIDRDFVAGIGSSGDNLAVVRTVVELGRTLRLETVAEGIEDADQLVALRRLGCHLGQGYHLARPLEPDAICGHFMRRDTRLKAA